MVSKADVAQLENLVEVAERARSAGHGLALLQWWRALAELLLALAARTRGWQVQVDVHWLAIVPPDSTCTQLSRALSLASSVPPTREMSVELSALCEATTVGDIVSEAARALALASLESAYVERTLAERTTRLLLECVVGIAAEFEANGLRQDPLPLPREGQPEVDMKAFILLSPMVPRVGQEVSAAIAQCEYLARGLAGS